MNLCCPVHSFQGAYDEARRIQTTLRKLLVVRDTIAGPGRIERVGGVDVAFADSGADRPPDTGGEAGESGGFVTAAAGGKRRSGKGRGYDRALAVAVVYDIRRGEVIESASGQAPVYFPYVPGFLTFREGPAVLDAIGKLTALPDVMLYDGCGILHPRGMGLASHMALMTGIPSVGCAKSLLCGSCDEPGHEKGSWTEIVYRDAVVGSCLRTRDGVRPVYVSPGCWFGVDGARELVLSLALKYRLPEPTRLAHKYVTAYRKRFVRSEREEDCRRGR